MNTCSTCRHWGHGQGSRSVCNLITTGGPSGTHKAQIGIWVGDDGPLFLTAATFGCTEHELPDAAS